MPAGEVPGTNEVAPERGEKDIRFPHHPFAIEPFRSLRDLANPRIEVALKLLGFGVGDDRLP